MKRQTLAVILSITAGAASFWSPSLVSAADQAQSPEEQDRSALADLRQQMGDLSLTDPRSALDRYTHFFGDHPALSSPVAIELSSTIAKLYSKGLKDNTQAIGTYSWAFRKYGKDPRAVPLLLEKAKLQEAGGDDTAAAATYEAALPAIYKGWPQNANEPLDDYSRLLLKSGKTDEVVQVLGKMLVADPIYLDPGPPNWDWVYPRIIEALQAAGQPRGAMRWARLRFMEAAYSVEPMRKASRLVAKTWTAADPGGAGPKAFVAAEEDPTLPNPLLDFSLPKLDKDTVTNRLAGATGIDRISIEIATGQLLEAMMDARDMTEGTGGREQGTGNADKTGAEGILQVCRVFKAADLNLKRANAYLQHLKSGQGPDPLAEFLKNPPPSDSPAAGGAPAGGTP